MPTPNKDRRKSFANQRFLPSFNVGKVAGKTATLELPPSIRQGLNNILDEKTPIGAGLSLIQQKNVMKIIGAPSSTISEVPAASEKDPSEPFHEVPRNNYKEFQE